MWTFMFLIKKLSKMDCLVPYSASENSDSEQETPTNIRKTISPPKKRKLPCAIEKLGARQKTNDEDAALATNTKNHQNRIRSFKHERGNWATFVYVPVDDSIFDEISELCQQRLAPIVELYACEDFHITLSKTVVLQYHLIDNFVETLKNTLIGSSFSAFLGQFEVYINAEKTRTFVGFRVESSLKLLDLLKKVDAVMLNFKLPTFYEEPSFHISFAWCLGNKMDVLNAELKSLTAAIEKQFPNSFTQSIPIKELRCKIGHKTYTFKLS